MRRRRAAGREGSGTPGGRHTGQVPGVNFHRSQISVAAFRQTPTPLSGFVVRGQPVFTSRPSARRPPVPTTRESWSGKSKRDLGNGSGTLATLRAHGCWRSFALGRHIFKLLVPTPKPSILARLPGPPPRCFRLALRYPNAISRPTFSSPSGICTVSSRNDLPVSS